MAVRLRRCRNLPWPRARRYLRFTLHDGRKIDVLVPPAFFGDRRASLRQFVGGILVASPEIRAEVAAL
jgi:hypothetical protein